MGAVGLSKRKQLFPPPGPCVTEPVGGSSAFAVSDHVMQITPATRSGRVHRSNHSFRHAAKMLLKLWAALAAIPLALCEKQYTIEDFTALAAKSSDGVIKLDEQLFDALTSPKRDWSVVVQLTALDKNMRGTPCR